MVVTTANASLHSRISQRLRESNLVYTMGRRQLVDLLVSFGRPASVPELLRRRPRLTQSSMYRNLSDLENAGIVHKVAAGEDHARFELNEEFIGHHHHLICIRCGEIDDFVVPPAVETALDNALSRAARAVRFSLTGHRLDAMGLCRKCA